MTNSSKSTDKTRTGEVEFNSRIAKWEIVASKPNTSIPDPIGFKWNGDANQNREGSAIQVGKRREAQLSIMTKRSWELTIAPAKSMAMNVFMLWMSGSGPGLFSVLIVGYALLNCVTQMARVNEIFAPFEKHLGTFTQKSAYIACNVAILAYLLSHASGMGILPTATGDWIQYIPETEIIEEALPESALFFRMFSG